MNPLDHFIKSDKMKKDKDKIREVLDKDLFSNNNIGTTLKSVFAPTPQVVQQRKEAVKTFVTNIAKPVQTTRSDMVGSAQMLGKAMAPAQPKITGATVRKFEVPLPKPTPTPKPLVYAPTVKQPIPIPKTPQPKVYSSAPSASSGVSVAQAMRVATGQLSKQTNPTIIRSPATPGQSTSSMSILGKQSLPALPSKERAEIIAGVTAGILKGGGVLAGERLAEVGLGRSSNKLWMDPPGTKHPRAPSPLVPLPGIRPNPIPGKAIPLPARPGQDYGRAIPLPVIIGKDYGKARPLNSGLGIIGGKL